MAEMLVQSHAGEIALLPALPPAWPSGEITGLRVRGAAGIDLAWHGGRATRVVIRPLVDGERTIRAPRGQTIDAVAVAGKPMAIDRRAGGVVVARLVAGREYIVSFK